MIVLSLVCIGLSAIVEPLTYETDCYATPPMHNGNYSGCTKKITKLKSLKITPPIFYFLDIISLILCFTLIVAHMLPIFVVLPMGGGTTSTGEPKSQSSYTEKAATPTIINTRKRAKNRINNDDEDDNRETKKPKKMGRPRSHTNHVCKDCTIWSLTGCHPVLYEHHQSIQMRHPGLNYRDMSDYASHGGITVALNPDSCICQNCSRDYYRNPTKPYWYRKYEEMINESGEQLELGAELEVYSEIEGASEDSIEGLVTTNSDTVDSDNMEEGDVTQEIGQQQFKPVIDHALLKLAEDGCIYSKDLVAMIKNPSIITLGIFYAELENVTKSKGYKCYSTNRKLGKLIYDPSKFSEHAITYTYKVHISKWQLQKQNKNTINENNIRKLIDKQCSTLPQALTYDYRTLINSDGVLDNDELDKHFNTDLCNFVEKITKSEKSEHRQHSTSYKNLRKLRIRMIICMLCMAMKPANSFFQTLLGVIAYLFGLRDRGFDILNSFGILCSVDQVRKHGKFWSKKRCATDELNKNALWRVSFDNLNFKMKFAKCLGSALEGVKKMLNLITAQVSTRRPQQDGQKPTKPCVQTLKTLAKDTLRRHFSNIKQKQPKKVTLHDLCFNDDDIPISDFCKTSYLSTINRITTSPLNCSDTFFLSLSKYLPHWTPSNGSDQFTFATIQEGQTATPDDVQAYLKQLKVDLKIGSEGFPNKIILAGDEQTYSIMLNIKESNGDTFDWFYPIPGDWHLLKLTAEQLRDIMWDGGLKEFAIKCGYKATNVISQWQDINLLLLATYEALMRKATAEFMKITTENGRSYQGRAFWQWIKTQTHTNNTDKLTQFWAQMLWYLNAYTAYFFSIRSGNWTLRNSSMKIITQLFFAYSHNKYEQLSMNTIFNSLTCPDDFLQFFIKGEWTCSIHGRPYHNLAIDEAHECIINNRVKNITSRPSHFRTVELADFIAYADNIVSGLQKYLNKDSTNNYQIKRYTCQRATIISELLKDAPLFKNTEQLLRNIFNSKPTILKEHQAHDLSAITTVGTERMKKYCTDYVLGNEPLKKRKKNSKLLTFTPRTVTNREQNSRVKQLEEINKNAMQALKASGVTVQTCAYPLAIAYMNGDARTGTKSSIRSVLQKQFSMCFDTLPPDISNVCLIADFMCYIHIPPPSNVATYSEYFDYLWSVSLNSFIEKTTSVVFVFDKPNYLPPPRSIVHEKRAKGKSKIYNFQQSITDHTPIPHNREYANSLAVHEFKSRLIQYLTDKLVKKCTEQSNNTSFVIDSPSLPSIVHIKKGILHTSEHNEHGEGDVAVWHHCLSRPEQNYIILSSDTDVWMYGLLVTELSFQLQSKRVYVKCLNSSPPTHINVTRLYESITVHPQLGKITHPCTSLVALYIATGSDYLSFFYRATKQNFFTIFLNNLDYICCNNKFVHVCDNSISILEDSWIKLVTSLYFYRFPKFFKSNIVSQVHNGVVNTPTADPFAHMLKWLGCAEKITGLKEWHSFIRNATFHLNKVGKDFEAKVMPSWDALALHCKRANYVLNIIISAKSKKCPTLNKHQDFGWLQIDNKITVNWGKADEIIDEHGCGCHGGCDTNRCSCYSASKQCTHACRCTNCYNSYSIGNNSSKQKPTTTVVAITEDKSMDTETNSDDSTDESDMEKVEEEIAPISNIEIMDWDDLTC